MLASVSFFAALRKSSQVQSLVGGAHAGLREQVLVVDEAEVVDQGRNADDLAVDRRRLALGGVEVVPVAPTAS